MKTVLTSAERKKRRLPREAEADLIGGPDLGICSNCGEAGHCRHRLYSKEPIFYCEEYHCISCQPPAGDKDEAADLSIAKPEPPETTPGLCANCDHVDTCRLPKPESGVWYCEEYE